jgi:hypothetical protein
MPHPYARVALRGVARSSVWAYNIAQRGRPLYARTTRMRATDEYAPTDWIDPRIEIRPSPIHGRGMFAVAPINQSEVVTIWGGTLLLTEEELAAANAADYVWATIGEGLYLARPHDPDREDLTDLINHSCDPNVWMQDEVTLVARRDIPVGQELTIDYAMFEADEDWVAPWKCRCGSELCRGGHSGRAWRRIELQERYGRHFSPFICARIDRLRASMAREHQCTADCRDRSTRP